MPASLPRTLVAFLLLLWVLLLLGVPPPLFSSLFLPPLLHFPTCLFSYVTCCRHAMAEGRRFVGEAAIDKARVLRSQLDKRAGQKG